MAYLSSAVQPPSHAELDRILSASRRNNTARQVTGLLCHYDGSFLQFLEGEEGDVEATFGVIATDKRHHGVITLFRRPIEERLFSEWSMALVKVDAVDPAQRAFCQGLREVEVGATERHRQLVSPFLDAFRVWMR